MISCTEFIPSYSELFTYLDHLGGHDEVKHFWDYLFAPTGKGIPLINFVRREGLRGCWNYWKGTLTEEAADCTMYINEPAGWSYSTMRYCPSKGRLLELQKEIGLEPYYDYCGHCDYYRSALEQVGLKWIRNHMGVDRAACSCLIYDPKVFNGMMLMDENVESMECANEKSKYFHRDFHSSLNMGIDYTARKFGEAALREYLSLYTDHVYVKTIRAMKDDPMGAIEAKIRETYRLEKAEDVLTIEKADGRMEVRVSKCPAVEHLHATGREVSKWFHISTEAVMQRLAEHAGLDFRMESYDPDTGAAAYCFEEKQRS